VNNTFHGELASRLYSAKLVLKMLRNVWFISIFHPPFQQRIYQRRISKSSTAL